MQPHSCRRAAIALVCCFLAAWTGSAATPASIPPRLQWWADARFGMFIHWGPVSLKGTEISWSRANTNPRCPNHGAIPAEIYDNLYRGFNPTNFDARQWVATAQAAGMKYMVLTAKHADGFLLWDSKVDAYNIMHSPFKRDVCSELAQAAHAQGMRLGWYFSPMDWRDPDCRSEHNDRFVAKMQAELRELLTHYGRIDLLWFDCDGREAPWEQAGIYALVKQLQPEIIINNRLDMGTDDNPGLVSNLRGQADYFTPEQWIGGYEDQHPWESCMTTSRSGQWAWGGLQDGVKTFAQLLEMVVRCAGGDGNVLLNVGPRPTGELDSEQANRLKEIGAWLVKHGESVYGTRGGPFKPGDYGVSTRKGNTIYLHISDWNSPALKLPPIPARVVRSRMLTGGKVEVRQRADGLSVLVPERSRQPLDTIVVLELDKPALNLDAIEFLRRLHLPRAPRPPRRMFIRARLSMVPTKQSMAAAIPAGRLTPAPNPPGWNSSWARPGPSIARSLSRRFRSQTVSAGSRSNTCTITSGRPATAAKTRAQRPWPISLRLPPSGCV